MNIIQESGMNQRNSKSLRREERRRNKQDRQKNNNIKLSRSIEKENKIPRSSFNPIFTKDPRVGVSPGYYKQRKFEYDIGFADRKGCWSWNETRDWTDEEYLVIERETFLNLSKDTWAQVESKTYNGKDKKRKKIAKHQALSSIVKEARQRWMELDEVSENETLFRIRTGTDKRIWGIRLQAKFYLVWYERFHRICPVND